MKEDDNIEEPYKPSKWDGDIPFFSPFTQNEKKNNIEEKDDYLIENKNETKMYEDYKEEKKETNYINEVKSDVKYENKFSEEKDNEMKEDRKNDYIPSKIDFYDSKNYEPINEEGKFEYKHTEYQNIYK